MAFFIENFCVSMSFSVYRDSHTNPYNFLLFESGQPVDSQAIANFFENSRNKVFDV